MDKKKIIIITLVSSVILAGGIGVGYFMFKGKDSNQEAEHAMETAQKVWNLYSAEEHHSKTLSDFLISANQGKRIVKMTVTIDFSSPEAYYKFQGYSDLETAIETEGAGDSGHGGGEESTHITPMELKINDAISDLMLSAQEEQLTDRETLKEYLKEGINKALGLKEEIVSKVYIENYVIQ